MADEKEKDIEKQKEEAKDNPPANDGKNSDNGDASEPELIKNARLAAERLEKANIEMKANLDRAERLKAAKILHGSAPAGKEETPIDPKKESFDRKVKAIMKQAGSQ